MKSKYKAWKKKWLSFWKKVFKKWVKDNKPPVLDITICNELNEVLTTENNIIITK